MQGTSPNVPQDVSRLGIDGDALRKPLSGVGQYIFNLCRELESLLPTTQFFVYTRLSADEIALPSSRWTVRREAWPLARKLPSFLWLKLRGCQLAKRDQLDVFWAGRTIHPGKHSAKRVVVTVHDLNHHLVPETMEKVTLYSHLLWFDRDVRSAAMILTNSQGTSDRLQHWVSRRADAIVYPGVRDDFRPLDPSQRETALMALKEKGVVPPYVLAVSTLEPRKNIGALIEAFVQLKKRGELRDHRLVLVGARGWQNQELARTIEANAEQGIVLPGYVPDELMPAIFALAEVLVMPSLYEGFGMPVLEARAVGTPVIVSDVAELKEAAGGQAQVVSPDAHGLEAALSQQALFTRTAPREALGDIQSWGRSARVMVAALTQANPDHTQANA